MAAAAAEDVGELLSRLDIEGLPVGEEEYELSAGPDEELL